MGSVFCCVNLRGDFWSQERQRQGKVHPNEELKNSLFSSNLELFLGDKELESPLCGNGKERLSTEPLKQGKPTAPQRQEMATQGSSSRDWPRASVLLLNHSPLGTDGQARWAPLWGLALLHNMVICFGNSTAFLYLLLIFCRKKYNLRSPTSDLP